ncbi:hypothetical protein PVA45_00995 [Entomospira entomophila]|uniref:DUF3106 domain-containing protein n=1 Tax=Entomospira entomophila TaxID=2719988 RepID=A0A968KS91_9SPIO|nr:hypothetical protein [Entomospira entomophilus]NIZ40097.1 hypothetical protein [Entomospira entomophilus]WDI35657.1 hypothetical protein PVA45_00995 [Entomospira entomophilus]
MNSLIKKSILTSSCLLFFSGSMLFAQQRPNPRTNANQTTMQRSQAGQQGDRSSRSGYTQKSGRSSHNSTQRAGTMGIYQTEWDSLSTEQQRELKKKAIDLGLTDKPTFTKHPRDMSAEERDAWRNSAERQQISEARREQMHQFWLEAAKLNVGPYAPHRKAATLERINAQQARIDQQRSTLS